LSKDGPGLSKPEKKRWREKEMKHHQSVPEQAKLLAGVSLNLGVKDHTNK